MKTLKMLAISSALLCSSCGPPEPPVSQVTSSGCSIHDYGKGVYYFSCSDGFGAALAEFRDVKWHKVISVTSFTDFGSASLKTGTSGYWVICEI